MRKGLRYGTISAALVLCGAFWMGSTDPDFRMGRDVQVLFNMFRETYMLYVDEVDPDKMLKNAARGMVADLDPYTELITDTEMDSFEVLTTGKYGGIGSLIGRFGDNVLITEPYLGSPADKAGIVIGDRIVAVEGKEADKDNLNSVSSMLRGEPGTKVRLTIEKLITGQRQELTLQRERIHIPGISYYGMLTDDIGYIAHDDFTEGCSDDIRNAIMKMKARGMTSLVYDLRGNGGGILQEAVKILSFFVPKGTEVVTMKGRYPRTSKAYITETEPIDVSMPIVVLTNGGSASASEIIAGALQDLDRAVIVGQRSFGKGLVQSPRSLGFNYMLKITTAKYCTPSGRCIQAIDYASHNEDGSVSFIPDSLIKEYRTAGGRKVYDGAGIMPDSVMTPEYTSRFALVLYGKNYIDRFANDFYKKHREGIDVDSFRLSEEDYNEFVSFMADKDVEYESVTKKTLAELKSQAQREGYMEFIEKDIETISEKIKADKARDLDLYKKDIVSLLEDAIVLRYHYNQGAVRHRVGTDKEVAASVSILTDRELYDKIVTLQDTKRKI